MWKEIDYGGMSEKEKQLLVQEVNLLRELRHPHIVRYHDRIIARAEATLYIIMEYCQGGDLNAIIARCKTERWEIVILSVSILQGIDIMVLEWCQNYTINNFSANFMPVGQIL